MLTNKYTLSSMSAFKIMKRPMGSMMDFWTEQLKPFLINTTTPQEFGLPWEHNISPLHSFFHCFSDSTFECVSCRKMMSTFLLRHLVNIALLFRKLFMPLTFKEINLKFAFKEFFHNRRMQWDPYVYLTIIPRARVGYEMMDSQRGT